MTTSENSRRRHHVAVIGGGPAGLMAADVISAHGVAVTLYERMPNLGRKLLLAGRGGLNLTHSEPLETFLARYGPERAWLEPAIRALPPGALIEFAAALGQETFTGSSGRIFPKAMKASPLLRAWLARLASQGVDVRLRHHWLGISGQDGLQFRDAAGGLLTARADAVVLALGGASWPRLGSDGTWRDGLLAAGIAVSPLQPANAGARITWSAHMRDRFAGAPLKRIALALHGTRARGEAVITREGLEGTAVYALSRTIRECVARDGAANLSIDLRPDLDGPAIVQRLSRRRGKETTTNWLRKTLAMTAAEVALLREAVGRELPTDGTALGACIKDVRLSVTGLMPIERAISTAGGISAGEIDAHFMLRRWPGIFVAGEMLDWEAPTGGYLLQATFATGLAAGRGALRFLGHEPQAGPGMPGWRA